MQKFAVSILFTCLLLLMPHPTNAAEESNITIKVNGYVIQMYEAPAYVDGKTNLTYVPLRFVSEALGAEIEYVNTKTPITTTINEPEHHEVKVLIDSKKVEVDGKVEDYPGAAVLQNGRTMVPLRVISEGLGAEVKWTPKSGGGGTVEINTPWETPVPEQTQSPSWNPTDTQKEYAAKVFKEFKWNNSTRTLTFNIPKMPGVNPIIGIQYGSTKEKITLGKDYTFKNLPSEFKIDINIFKDDTFTAVVDQYTIMSYDYAKNNKWLMVFLLTTSLLRTVTKTMFR